MLAGDDAAVLADHVRLVNASCKLTVGAVPVDIFPKQQLHRRLSEFLEAKLLYTIAVQIASRHFSENQTRKDAKRQFHQSKARACAASCKCRARCQLRIKQPVDRDTEKTGGQGVQQLRQENRKAAQPCGREHCPCLCVDAQSSEGEKHGGKRKLDALRERKLRQRARAPGKLQNAAERRQR